MSDKEIRLTPDELEIIKDDVRFRENVTLRLKSTEGKVDDLNETIDFLKSLRGWVTAHTWAIGILFALVTLVIGMCAR